MPTNPIKTLSSKIVYQNPWMKIHEDKVIHPNGKQSVYGYLSSHDSVMVCALNDRNQLFLEKAYRYPSKSAGWELPGGNSDGEETMTASQRELKEETGITAKHWSKLGEAYVCNGFMTEKQAVYLAQELDTSEHQEDEAEIFSERGFFSIKKVNQMIQNGDINDCQSLAGIHYLKLWLEKEES